MNGWLIWSLLSVKLDFLDEWNSKRIENAMYYNSLLSGIKQIKTPTFKKNTKHVFHQYTIKVESRDKLKEYLYNNKIESAIYYPIPCHLQEPYKNISLKAPISKRLSRKVLSLPISEHINNDNIEFICNSIRNFYS